MNGNVGIFFLVIIVVAGWAIIGLQGALQGTPRASCGCRGPQRPGAVFCPYCGTPLS